jgi:hypothetical protein
MINKKKIIALGKHLDEGQDVFQISTVEDLAFLKALNKIEYENTFMFMDAFVFGDGDYGGGEIDAEKLPKSGKLKYLVGMRDYNSSDNMSLLKERYDEYGDISNEMQKYLRSKKIKKIENENKN